MKPIISLIIFGILALGSFAQLAQPEIYFIEYNFNKGAFRLIDVSFMSGFYPLQKDITLPYKAEILSINNEILYVDYFDTGAIELDPPGESPTDLGDVDSSISLPYFKNGHSIRVTKDNKELLNIDISKFKKYCGDGICQPNEDYQACPADCVDAQTAGLAEETQKLGIRPMYIGAILLLLFIVLSLAYMEVNRMRHHKVIAGQRSQNSVSDLRKYVAANLKKGYSKEQIKKALIKNKYSNEEIDEGFKGIK